jgi:hypothetical protein
MAAIAALLFVVSAASDAHAWTPSISVNKGSPQPVGTQITFTGSVSGAWATPQYLFLASTNYGGSWFTLRDYSTSNTFVWTPTEVRNNWWIAVKVYMEVCDPETGECYGESDVSQYIPFSTDSAVAGVSLSANMVSGQPLGTTVT